jgi:hypothetical protein
VSGSTHSALIDIWHQTGNSFEQRDVSLTQLELKQRTLTAFVGAGDVCCGEEQSATSDFAERYSAAICRLAVGIVRNESTVAARNMSQPTIELI